MSAAPLGAYKPAPFLASSFAIDLRSNLAVGAGAAVAAALSSADAL